VATSDIPDDKDALKAALIETRAKLSGAEAMIEHLQLVIAKMKRAMFGQRSERSQRLLDQLELQLEELSAAVGEDAARAAAAGVQVQSFTRRKATRRNFPEHLPRRRVVHPAPTACPFAIATGFVYLAAILDAWSRRAVGYAIGADPQRFRGWGG
jgi:hypothetical protein